MATPRNVRRRLGDILVESGLVTREQLTEALEYQKLWGHRLGTALVAKKFITENELIDVLARELRVETADPGSIEIPADVLQLVPKQVAAANDLIPLGFDDRNGTRRIVVAMVDPLNYDAITRVRQAARMEVHPVIATMSSVSRAIRERYGLVAAADKAPAYADAEMVIVHKGGDEVTLGANGQKNVQPTAQRPTDAFSGDTTSRQALRTPQPDATHVPQKLQYPPQVQATQQAYPVGEAPTYRQPTPQYPPGYPQPAYAVPGYPQVPPSYPGTFPNPYPGMYPSPAYPQLAAQMPTPQPMPAYPGNATFQGAANAAMAGLATQPSAPPPKAPPTPVPTAGQTIQAGAVTQPSVPPGTGTVRVNAAVPAAKLDEISKFAPRDLLLGVIRTLIRRGVISADDLLEELRRRG